MDLQDLLKNPPKLATSDKGLPISWSVNHNVLMFIEKHVNDSWRTLETGAGVSTVLFALKRSQHTCIDPNINVIQRIKAYCAENQIPIENVRFEVGSSQDILPVLKMDKLDLALIDGDHAFPIPFIDWYYTACALKVHGLLIIDDTQIKTGYILRKFLLSDPSWKLAADFLPRASVFIKQKEKFLDWWGTQPYLINGNHSLKIWMKIHQIKNLFKRLFKTKITHRD
jgi:hypothetical protein